MNWICPDGVIYDFGGFAGSLLVLESKPAGCVSRPVSRSRTSDGLIVVLFWH
jgi:hypothetical protein